MTGGCTHIVGAGVAGLAAAHAVLARGGAVALYEAAPQAGGRCRTVRTPDGFEHDNGTHVLFTANRRALALIDAAGARDGWIEPEPDGLPVYDADNGRLARVGLTPWSWLRRDRRPAGLDLKAALRLARLSLPVGDRSVAEVMGDGPLTRSLVEPLTVAVLNTPLEAASARRLGIAMRRLARPGAGRLLVARRGLSADLVEPALGVLAARGVSARFGERLRAVIEEDGRAAALAFASGTVPLRAQDRVILALPPHEIARLLPGLPVPDTYEAILNVHYRVRGSSAPRFVGLLGTLAQWALVRDDHVSVTVSAAGAAVDHDAEHLGSVVWQEIVPALRALDIAVDPTATPPARVVKERRATIRQATGRMPQPPLRPLANLTLAGDWIGTLPATIESAATAGERAAAALDAAPAAGRRPAGIAQAAAGGAS